MGNGVEIFSTFPISDPQTFLTGSFEARIVSFALCAQSIQTLETKAFSVYGHSVIVGNYLVLCTAAVLFPVVPVFVIAGTGAGL